MYWEKPFSKLHENLKMEIWIYKGIMWLLDGNQFQKRLRKASFHPLKNLRIKDMGSIKLDVPWLHKDVLVPLRVLAK